MESIDFDGLEVNKDGLPAGALIVDKKERAVWSFFYTERHELERYCDQKDLVFFCWPAMCSRTFFLFNQIKLEEQKKGIFSAYLDGKKTHEQMQDWLYSLDLDFATACNENGFAFENGMMIDCKPKRRRNESEEEENTSTTGPKPSRNCPF